MTVKINPNDEPQSAADFAFELLTRTNKTMAALYQNEQQFISDSIPKDPVPAGWQFALFVTSKDWFGPWTASVQACNFIPF